MHLKISAQFTLKDRPAGYLGLTGERWQFGIKPLPLAQMCVSVLDTIFSYYLQLGTADELNAELDRLRAWLAAKSFLEEMVEDVD